MKKITKVFLLILILVVSILGCSKEPVFSPEETVLSALDIFYQLDDKNNLSTIIYGKDTEKVRADYLESLTQSFTEKYTVFTDEQNKELSEKLVAAMQKIIVYDISKSESTDKSSDIMFNVHTLDLDNFLANYNKIYTINMRDLDFTRQDKEQIDVAYQTYLETIDLLNTSPNEFEKKTETISVHLENTSKNPLLNSQSQWVITDIDKFINNISTVFTGI